MLTSSITRQQAYELLTRYNHEPFHIQHALTVEGVMRWYANELGHGDEADFWAIVGLLHDVDFELYPEQHCVKAPELLGWELDTLLERTIQAMRVDEAAIAAAVASLE